MTEILKFLTENICFIILFFALCGGGIAAFFRGILERRHVAQREQAARDHEYRMLVERRKLAEGMEKLVDAVLVDKVLADDFERRFQERRGVKNVPPTRVYADASASPVATQPEAPPVREDAAARELQRRNGA